MKLFTLRCVRTSQSAQNEGRTLTSQYSQTKETNVPLVGKSDGVQPSLIRQIPATVAHVVDSESVTLSPVAIELANVVKPGRVVIRGLEVLRLEHSVVVRKVELSNSLLALSTAESGDVRNGTGSGSGSGSTNVEGQLLPTHGRSSDLNKGGGRSSLKLRSRGRHHGRLSIDQERRLLVIDWLRLKLSLLLKLRLQKVSLRDLLRLDEVLSKSRLLNKSTKVSDSSSPM